MATKKLVIRNNCPLCGRLLSKERVRVTLTEADGKEFLTDICGDSMGCRRTAYLIIAELDAEIQRLRDEPQRCEECGKPNDDVGTSPLCKSCRGISNG